MTGPATARAGWRDRDPEAGFDPVGTAITVPAVLLILALTVGFARVTSATQDVSAAAYTAAHADYLARRAELGQVAEIEGVSAGGMPTRVKCLHVLVAHALAPEILDYCVFAHRSNEAGHVVQLARLGVEPLVQLDLRLGEGTGAALAYPLVQAAVNFMNEMASFESAGVAGKA